MKDSLPYVDEILAGLKSGHPAYQLTLGRHIHFGYWDNPQTARASFEDYGRATDNLIKVIFECAKVENQSAVVDIGCGFGGTVALLNENYRDMNLCGINIDPRQLEVARASVTVAPGSQNIIQFIQADACQMNLAPNSFQTATAIDCIFHFRSRLSFMKEVYKILRPKGRLVITEMVINPARLPMMALLALKDIRVLAEYHKALGPSSGEATVGTYRRLARRSGLVLTEVRDITQNIQPSFQILRNLHGTVWKETGYEFPSIYSPRQLDFFGSLVQAGCLKYVIFIYEKP